MTIEANLGLGPTSAHSRTQPVAPWLAVAGVLLAACWIQHALPLNVDVSWWLLVSERVLDGQRLYVDILETNPPMAGSVYVLAVALARAIGIRSETATYVLIFALIATSLALVWLVLRT